MKKRELIKIIETVVRKEVKKQMNEIFINDNNTSQLTELVPQGEGGVSQVGGYEEYPTLGDGTFDSSKINDVLVGSPPGVATTETVKQKKRDIGAVQTIKNARVNVDQVPDHVQDALTRDYSDVMKAIDQKKGGTNFRP